MPPRVEARLPGGLDLVREYVRDREERFLCEWCVVCILYGRLNGGVGRLSDYGADVAVWVYDERGCHVSR